MGGNKPSVIETQSSIVQPVQELTVLERWTRSEHSQEDLLLLLKHTSEWSECEQPVSSFLQNINNRQKYQNCISIVLDYFKGEDSSHGCSQIDRKQLFTYYITRLAHSFFVIDDFHQSSINLCLRPKDKLLFIYEYFSQTDEDLIEKAISFNYPSIYSEFKEFISQLIEREIVVKKPELLLKFIMEQDRLQIVREDFQEMSKHFSRMLYDKSMQQLQNVYDIKKIFMLGAAQFTKYDNGDTSGLLLAELLRKGYQFTEQDYEYYLKIELYSMFLYSMEKLSYNFSEFQSKKVVEIIHLFYNAKNIEDTPLLLRCFDIFGKKTGQKKTECLLQYCFSPQAHISLLIRLLEHKYIEFSGSAGEYSGICAKVIASRCQIGRYQENLVKIVKIFKIQAKTLEKFNKLMKVILFMHIFGLDNVNVEQIYTVAYCDPTTLSGQALAMFQEGCLSLFRMIVKGFLEHSQTITKRVIIEEEQYKLQKLYDFLPFLTKLKDYLTKDVISSRVIHEILFKQLISKQYYLQMQALLSPQSMKTYSISIQSAQMLIIDHLTCLLATKKIKPFQQSIALLLKMINLTPQSHHYIVSYYKYFKYLEGLDIALPLQVKKDVSIKHFYHIVDSYPNKVENIDFDYLYSQLSCIRENYIEVGTPFEPIVTDEYLKFKVHLSNKCYNLKKVALGNQIIEEVMAFEPPWFSSDLVKILRENPNIDDNFIKIAFKHCTRGEDLQYIIALHSKKQLSMGSSSKLSFQQLKKFNDSMLKTQKYAFLESQLIISQRYYIDLVAEMTYNKDQESKSESKLFFKLLTTEPERAFNYAVNYIKTVSFIYNFLMEGVRRNVIHLTRLLPLLVRFLWFKLEKQQRNHSYIKYKEYLQETLSDIIGTSSIWNERPAANVQILTLLKKTIKSYEVSLDLSPVFLDLYINQSQQYKFIYDQGQRKRLLLQIREQPMSKTNSIILLKLCSKISVDIIELSLYELIGKINSKEDIDDESWTIIQKLVVWADNKTTALKIIKKLCQKIQGLALLVRVLEYMRESQEVYREIISAEHLEVIGCLAAVQQENNFYGIVPENFFERSVGKHPNHPKGLLSECHRQILQRSGSITNIFVLSKALYFMYGCDEQIEKVVLGDFSFKQEDSQEFQILRKKIKTEMS